MKNAAGLVSGANSGWKCALVSQGIVCGNGGSVKAENCVFRGIESFLKNNDSNSAENKVSGGYQIVNCSYQLSETSAVYTGSSSDSNAALKFPNSTPGVLKPDLFSWHTENGEQPFTPSVTELSGLKDYLGNAELGAGAKSEFPLSLLKSKY